MSDSLRNVVLATCAILVSVYALSYFDGKSRERTKAFEDKCNAVPNQWVLYNEGDLFCIRGEVVERD